MVTVFNKNSYV